MASLEEKIRLMRWHPPLIPAPSSFPDFVVEILEYCCASNRPSLVVQSLAIYKHIRQEGKAIKNF
jgi:hypothetical protein